MKNPFQSKGYLGLHLVIGLLVFAGMTLILGEIAEDIMNGEPLTSRRRTTQHLAAHARFSALNHGFVGRYVAWFHGAGKLHRGGGRTLFAMETTALLARGYLAIGFRWDVTQQTVEVCISSSATSFRRSDSCAHEL